MEEWLYMLNQPLPWENATKVTEAMAEDEGAGFMALMGEMKGQVG